MDHNKVYKKIAKILAAGVMMMAMEELAQGKEEENTKRRKFDVLRAEADAVLQKMIGDEYEARKKINEELVVGCNGLSLISRRNINISDRGIFQEQWVHQDKIRMGKIILLSFKEEHF